MFQGLYSARVQTLADLTMVLVGDILPVAALVKMEDRILSFALGVKRLASVESPRRTRKSCVFPVVPWAVVLIAMLGAPNTLAAQNFRVLYNFHTNPENGFQPSAGLTFDMAGNLYGTTRVGGTLIKCNHIGCGTVFTLSLNNNGKWVRTTLHHFSNGGGYPIANVIFDTAGNLYSTTFNGGTRAGGTVFELILGSDGRWTQKVLYDFDVLDRSFAGVIMDTAGNLYGTTDSSAFELTRGTDGQWSVTNSWGFSGGGGKFRAGLVLDKAGNLYGTTSEGGTGQCPGGCGSVFELTPGMGGQWTGKILYNFQGKSDGSAPVASLILDGAGNLYGTTSAGGQYPLGVVFKLTRGANGQWTETVLHDFHVIDGGIPLGSLVFDTAGNLYGTTSWAGAYGFGTVFELKPGSGGNWTETVLHNFKSESSAAGLIIDATGKLYGTTVSGGAYGGGTVFEVTP